jgi:ABC-type Fe3+ transport system permease subunit
LSGIKDARKIATVYVFAVFLTILLFGTDGKFRTMTLSFWIFKQVYGIGEFGGSGSYNLVSATGLCFTLVGVPIILLTHWLVEKVPSVEY